MQNAHARPIAVLIACLTIISCSSGGGVDGPIAADLAAPGQGTDGAVRGARDAAGPGDAAAADLSGGQTGATCRTGPDCAPPLVCDEVHGRCVACRVTAECGPKQICSGHTCQDAMPCTGDVQCKAAGLVCDTKNSRCVECNGAGDCAGNDPGALPAGSACLGNSCYQTRSCMSTKDCPGALVCIQANPPAWPGGFTGKGCAECASGGDCAMDSACQGGLCMPVCQRAGLRCGTYMGATCGVCPMAGKCDSLGNACYRSLASLQTYGGPGSAMVLSDSYLYAGTNGTAGYMLRLARDTGTVNIVGSATNTKFLAMNSTHVLWDNGITLYRAARGSTAQSMLRSFQTGDTFIGLAADDTNVYVGVNQASPSWIGVYQVPIAGGAPVQLTPADKNTLVVFMLPAKNRLYYISLLGAFVGYVPVGGGTAVRLATRLATGAMLEDGSYLYYTTGSTIYRVPLDGGPEEVVLALNGPSLQSWLGQTLLVQTVDGLQVVDVAAKTARTILTQMDPASAGGSVVTDGSTIYALDSSVVWAVQQL